MWSVYATVFAICYNLFPAALAATKPINTTTCITHAISQGSSARLPVNTGYKVPQCLDDEFHRYKIPESQLYLLYKFEEQLQYQDVRACLVSAAAWLNVQRKTGRVRGGEFVWCDCPLRLKITRSEGRISKFPPPHDDYLSSFNLCAGRPTAMEQTFLETGLIKQIFSLKG